MTTITVDDNVLRDLKYLQNEVLLDYEGKRPRSMNRVIELLMARSGFNAAFFERIREKVSE